MNAEPPPIQLDTILAELERLGFGREVSAGQSVQELVSSWGMGIDAVRKVLRRASKAGILRSSRSVRSGIDGMMRSVPVYWIEAPLATKKKK